MNARDISRYLGEFQPTSVGTPAKPCGCGDTVFYRLASYVPWLCRSRRPPGKARWRRGDDGKLRTAVRRRFVAPRPRS
jgi:hypothetical protein